MAGLNQKSIIGRKLENNNNFWRLITYSYIIYESKMSQWKYLKHNNKEEYFNKLGKDIS